MYPILYSNAFLMLLGASLWGHGSSDTRVVSGRKICYAGYKHPCYKIAYFQDLAARVGYHHAHHVCSGEGGHLLSVESEAEQKLIERMLQNLTNSGSGKSDGDFWIGLSRNVESMATSGGCPDLYKWADGSTALFRNWYADEPSCGSEACVVMYHQPTANPGIGGLYMYQWNDDRCNMKHNFICKYPPDPQSPVTTERTYVTDRPDDSSHVTAIETAKNEQRPARPSLLCGFQKPQGMRSTWRYRYNNNLYHHNARKKNIYPKLFSASLNFKALAWNDFLSQHQYSVQQEELTAPP
ncbi:chondrolectin isoform X2 [Aquarana catesbeiana]|uniref:chondrolectin isoform X2 n=1 Tax=Aquarana catesbeiana TaxID=8400 RepID=UPI003CC93C14